MVPFITNLPIMSLDKYCNDVSHPAKPVLKALINMKS